jgi:hypothetical protein
MARAAVVALLTLVGVVMRVDALADSLRVNKPLVPFKLEPLRWGSVRPRGWVACTRLTSLPSILSVSYSAPWF